ncbi:MAG: DUF1307 domain-containing protein [Coprobacillaceae bacterium]
MKRVLGLSAVLLLLTGCFGGKETTTVCKMENDYGTTEATYEAKGDEVTEYTIVAVEDYNDYIDTSVYSDADIKEMYEDEYADDYEGLDGVDFKVEVKDGVMTRTLTVNYSKADMDELVAEGLVEASNGNDVDYVSLDLGIEDLEKQGFKCKEK